jgi:hypothetical protein
MNELPIESGDTRVRLPYERPQLGKVRLEADQVLTAGCKTGPAPNSGASANICTVGPCNQTIGS